MIGIIAALAVQSALQQEAPVLLEQSTARIINSYGDMAEALGKCATVYPGGSANPYVVRARQDVAAIGFEPLTFEVQRVESILFAQAAQKPAVRGLTVLACADEIEGAASDVSAHASGLVGLLETLERDSRRQ